MDLTVKVNQQIRTQNRFTNCVIAATITSLSRIFIAEQIDILVSAGATIFYTSTDNICYTLPRTVTTPLMYGPCINDFKKEFGILKIVSFYSVGPKETSITYTDVDNMQKCKTKVKGLQLQNAHNFKCITPAVLERFLRKFLNNLFDYISVPQLRQRQNKPLSAKQLVFMKFTNRTGCKRILLDLGDARFPTLPLGFTRTMLNLLKK